MDYIISADTACDMPEEFFKENHIPVVSLSFVMEGKTYGGEDGEEMPLEVFYDKVKQGKTATTNQVNVADHMNLFEQAAAEGKDVLHISLSSGLSGTYQSAVIAAQEAGEKYPGRKFFAVDSLCASHGQGLFLYYVVENRKKGMSLEENLAWIQENVLHLCHWFTVDDLEHLHRGGRVSKAAAVMGGMLGIKPVLHVDHEGRLIAVEKVRGRPKSIDSMITHMKNTIVNPEGQLILVGHTNSLEDANFLAQMAREAVPGAKDVKVMPIGPVIGAHTGIGCLSLFFLGSER